MAKKDSLVEAPATAWWFEGLRIGLRQQRPYGVEKIVEPEVFKKVKSGYSHTNKWRVYKSGARRPRASLIEKAERVLPGSAAAFFHPLWMVGRLKAGEKISGVANDLLHQLNVEILPLFFRVDKIHGIEVRRGVSARVLRALTHRADLEAFTALSILLREAAENYRYREAMAAADALHQALLHAAARGSEQMQIVLPKIFEMLVARVFPVARDRQHCYCFEGLNISGFLDLFRWRVRSSREAQGLSLDGILVADVESAIHGGISKQFGVLHFSSPKRPLSPTGLFVEAEENFLDHMEMWQVAISNLRSMHS